MTREEAIEKLELMRQRVDEETYRALILAIKALEQEPIEVEATKLQMAYNQGFEDCRKAVMDLIRGCNSALEEPRIFESHHSGNKFEHYITELQSVNPQKPKTGHWSHDSSHWKNRFICSECGYKLFDEPTSYCPSCGCRMVEPQESEDA